MLPNSEGQAWTPKQIVRAMRAAVTAAKLPPAVFYDLRRSYGSLLANAGAGLSIIANALGHADTRMTKRHYAHLLDSVVAAELQAKLPTFRTRSSRKAAARMGNQQSAGQASQPEAEENRRRHIQCCDFRRTGWTPTPHPRDNRPMMPPRPPLTVVRLSDHFGSNENLLITANEKDQAKDVARSTAIVGIEPFHLPIIFGQSASSQDPTRLRWPVRHPHSAADGQRIG